MNAPSPREKQIADHLAATHSWADRQVAFDALVAEIEPDPNHDCNLDEARENVRRWCLVQKNTGGNEPSHWFTCHHSRESAAIYVVNEEYASDWETVVLADLDTDARFTEGARTITWEAT